MPSNAPPMLPHSLTVPDVFAELWGPWGSTSQEQLGVRTRRKISEGSPGGLPFHLSACCFLHWFGASTRIRFAVIVNVPEATTFPFKS